MPKKQNTIHNFTSKQLKLPLDLERIIDISDPVYTFSEVIDHIDLNKYLSEKGGKIGRPRCEADKMLKVILFAFMEHGYVSLRRLEKLCKTDIRYMWILDEMQAPSFMTFGNFIKNELFSSIDSIFKAINEYIFKEDHVDLKHIYIDGTKIIANANKYTWVWKKSCITNRDKVFLKLTELLKQINGDIASLGVRFEEREEYAIEYVEQILLSYAKLNAIDPSTFVCGRGRHKTAEQRIYQKIEEYLERLKRYAKSVEICGEGRNSYSKTDQSATFMRVKTDYMGNDQLLPAYNMQIGICDEYIAVVDAKQYASDTECFVPLMRKFHDTYGQYPKYPIADAGYGSYNNYLFCEEHGMKKYMKFTMFEKETKDTRYRNDPYRAVNFRRDEEGNLICPNEKKFVFKESRHIKHNKYGRTEEIYECEDCSECPFKKDCSPKSMKNRTIRMNQELTAIHEEVLENLCSIQGALLCMNRSIQAEGTYGIVKWDRSYSRAFRRGLDNVILEFTLISCGFNIYKYHNKRKRQRRTGNAA